MKRNKVAIAAAAALACCASGLVAPTESASASSAIFTSIDETHPITLGAPMNPYNTKGNSFDSYDQMELGYNQYNGAHPDAMFPALAATWKTVRGGLDVYLQAKADWSDGEPVTSSDVKTSVANSFIVGTQASNLAGVTVLGPKEIRFNEEPGTHNSLFAAQVLETIIVPNSEYGALLPSDIWSVISASEGKGGAAQKAKATLTKLAPTVEDYAPKTDISAGPFYIARLNAGEALLVKNKYFFDASKISPEEVVLRNYTGNEEIWNYMEAGQLDFAPYTSMPSNVLHDVLRAGNKELVAPSFVAVALAFDEARYPYGIAAVRKALAYLLNRPAITKVGEPVSGAPAKWQTGLIDSVSAQWLPSSELSKFNRYNYDPAKATSLLKAVGFTERSGQWHMPNGKAWKITLATPSGFSDWDAAAVYMSHELSAFGIPTSVSTAPDYATYLTNIANGDYATAFWLNALGPAVYNAYARVWGNNVTSKGNELTTKGSFLHTPATFKTDGYGTVALNTLTEGLENKTTAQARPVVAKLAAAYNQELPMITIWDYVLVEFVTDKHFTDWPSSPGLLNNPPGLWMWNGYVNAK
jgi:peptide/nickel transport system substrate-binding protein